MNLESCGILKKYIDFNFLSCHFVNIQEKIPLTNKSTFINRTDTIKHIVGSIYWFEFSLPTPKQVLQLVWQKSRQKLQILEG
jgi:hypothetical protein